MIESEFQRGVIEEIEKRLPGSIVLKNDPTYLQGIPDISIFYKKRWAVLECKKSEKDPHRPNQDYYVEQMDNMSFARFIYPENQEEVLNELERSFKTKRTTRLSKCK